ncbi:uncharacterized protein LOC132553120 [Ylistrum balloti]|uniref:uncharacterized protein LOC132553120 n=1 Tax=Ylistrum balloti TaxID=509963 RepID=UPI00290583A9|nr:uncharacterized protein LOC132553120 [Ylistrum balloti]
MEMDTTILSGHHGSTKESTPQSQPIQEQNSSDNDLQILRNRGRLENHVVNTTELIDDPKRKSSSSFVDLLEDSLIQRIDSDVEAHKISNNYLFGFKKWKGHVTDRPLSSRSEVVQNLYEDFDKIQPVNVSTLRPSNLLYVLLFGWWLALLYLIVGCLMFLSVVGWNYGVYCWMLARYFLWPFGKFVHLLNFKAITQIMFLPPQKLKVEDYSYREDHQESEILMYTHQSVYLYYYKYSVDGMNIILFNLLVFVILALALGYTDPEHKITTGVTKCILGVCAIIPLTYYIGLAIISIAAQSTFTIGAVLNATFGSVVEIIIFVLALSKGSEEGSGCYVELVKSSLTGAIVGSLLFIPGICMVVGGIKYHSQRFNPRAANVTALLLFVAVGGVYAPTIFAKIFGNMHCKSCVNVYDENATDVTSNSSYSLHCSECRSSVSSLEGDSSLYRGHVKPLVYACSVLLPIAYIIGMIFALKTHSANIAQHDHSGDVEVKGEHHKGTRHGTPSWSRIKSAIILLVSAALIALCAELVTENIQVLIQSSGVSEVIWGSLTVCVPVYLVLINLIQPFGFLILFNDIHLWSVVFSVIVINYTFQDGKSDYFQGFTLVTLYAILLCTHCLPCKEQTLLSVQCCTPLSTM